MTKEKKSYDLHVELPDTISKNQVMDIIEKAANSANLYISHIGSYSRKKYPNSVHWHFKRNKNEVGLIDATYWDIKSLLWLMIRHREPTWVHKTAPMLQKAISQEIEEISGSSGHKNEC